MNKMTITLLIIGGIAIAAVFTWPFLYGKNISNMNNWNDNTPSIGPHHWEVGKDVSPQEKKRG